MRKRLSTKGDRYIGVTQIALGAREQMSLPTELAIVNPLTYRVQDL